MQTLFSRRIGFYSLHYKLILVRDCILVFWRVLGTFEQDFKTRRNLFSLEVAWTFRISSAFFEKQCFTCFLPYMGILSSGLLVILWTWENAAFSFFFTIHSLYSWCWSLIGFFLVFADGLNDLLRTPFAYGEPTRCVYTLWAFQEGGCRPLSSMPMWFQLSKAFHEAHPALYFHDLHLVALLKSEVNSKLDKVAWKKFPTWNMAWI